MVLTDNFALKCRILIHKPVPKTAKKALRMTILNLKGLEQLS